MMMIARSWQLSNRQISMPFAILSAYAHILSASSRHTATATATNPINVAAVALSIVATILRAATRNQLKFIS